MKKRNKLFAVFVSLAVVALAFVAICAVPFSAASKGPVSYYGQLNASQNRIVGSKTGSPAQVKGMSFFWSNWCSYWNASTVNRMADEFKCEIVRASYGVTDNGAPYNSADEGKLREVINAAIANDIYVIIDWHSHGAHSNTQAAKDFFSRMAKDFGKYDNVIFEIYNEPTQIDWSTIKGYAEQVIPVIREHSDNLVIVGTPMWSQDVDAAANNPVNAKNVAYALHFYAGTHSGALRDKANYALNKGVALFVTEWGSVNADGDGGINYNSTNEWLSWMDSNKLSWCNWAINDKAEGSSIFNPGGSLTGTGQYLKGIITKHAENAEWRKAPVETDPPVIVTTPEETTTPPPPNTEVYELPGRLEAENYASMNGIQTEECGEGGINIGYLDSGDWLTYNVNVKSAGEYKLECRVASETTPVAFTISDASGKVLSTINGEATGSWQTWTTVSSTIKLEAGKQQLKINITGSNFNINYLDFTATSVKLECDANGDGQTDINDVKMIKSYLHGKGFITSIEKQFADFDGDGQVTVLDLNILLANI